MWDEKIVGSTFKRSPKLRSTLASSLRSVQVSTAEGLYLGKAMRVAFDRGRIDRLFQKIARGLFRFHLGRRLPSDSFFAVKTNVNERLLVSTGLLDDLGPVFSMGNGSVIQYRFGIAREPECSVWVLHLYQSTIAVVFVNVPED
jgi:hypothetical protein